MIMGFDQFHNLPRPCLLSQAYDLSPDPRILELKTRMADELGSLKIGANIILKQCSRVLRNFKQSLCSRCVLDS